MASCTHFSKVKEASMNDVVKVYVGSDVVKDENGDAVLMNKVEAMEYAENNLRLPNGPYDWDVKSFGMCWIIDTVML